MTAEEKIRIISNICIAALEKLPYSTDKDTPYYGTFLAIWSILTLDAEEA